MSNPSQFLYVTYIRTTPEKLWEALTNKEFNKQFWFGMWQESEWKKGSDWKITGSDGKVWDAGKIVEVDRPKKLVISWQHQMKPELKAEGVSLCTFTLEPNGEQVKLTVRHELENGEKFIQAVSGGWPAILSSLKTLLETGEALPRPPG